MTSALIMRFGRFLTGKRFAGQVTYQDGYPVPAAEEEITFFGSVQQLSTNEAGLLPEGVQLQDARKIYTTFSLIQAGAGLRADRVLIDGQWYEVQNVDDWVFHNAPVTTLRYYKATVLRVTEVEGQS